MTKLWQQDVRKAEARAKKEKEDAEAQAKRAEEARKVTIEEDQALPKATRAKISKLEGLRGQRVTVRYRLKRLTHGNRQKNVFPLFRCLVGFTACVGRARP